MTTLFLPTEKLRIAFTYGLLCAESSFELALPALIGLAIDDILADRFQGIYLMLGCIFALICSGSMRKLYDTRCFGRIQMRLAGNIGKRDAPISQKIAHVRLLDDFVQFLDTYLPQALSGFIGTTGAVAALFWYNWKVAASAILTLTMIGLITAAVAIKTAKLNRRINHRLEHEASVLNGRSAPFLLRHMEVLRRLRNTRSDAETVIFAGGWTMIAGLLFVSIFLAADPGVTAGQIFAILSYVLAIADGFATLPPMIERLTRSLDIARRLTRV